MILIYLAVIILYFVLWSFEDPLVPGWLVAAYAIDQAVGGIVKTLNDLVD